MLVCVVSVAKVPEVGTSLQKLAKAVLAQHGAHRQQFEVELDDCAVRGELRINVIAIIVVENRTKVLILKAFSAKCEPFVLVNHGAHVRWDEGCAVEVEFLKEGVVGG